MKLTPEALFAYACAQYDANYKYPTVRQVARKYRITQQAVLHLNHGVSTRGKKGPGLKGVFQSKYLPVSGLPANDERVGELIVTGRNMMPAFGQVMSQQQVQDLLAYLHTL